MIGLPLIEAASSEAGGALRLARRAWRGAPREDREQLAGLAIWAAALALAVAAIGPGAIALAVGAELGVCSDLDVASIQAGGAASADH